MRIAIVHYHLRPGGVTRVLENTLAALCESTHRIALLTGTPGDDPRHVTVPALDYTEGVPAVDAKEMADQLETAAGAALGGPPDVWHLHNHNLGKHPTLTAAVPLLADRGHRLLLHLHDFAEDGRPANYRLLAKTLSAGLARAMYPAGAHVHYATLNTRDRAVLATAGVPSGQLHLLPNPVASPPEGAQPSPSEPLILYPTRAIRRKNIGEFLLGVALGPPHLRYALTLAPTAASDLEPYRKWRHLAERLRLPVEFEWGLRPGTNYADLVRSARALATTSVAEGFGLAFLEPWLAGRPLVGRDLPEITYDLKAEGLRLPGLYERCDVTLTGSELQDLRHRIAAGLTSAHEAYGRSLPRDATEDAWNAAVRGDDADFGRLDEDLQRSVLERLAGAAHHTACAAARLGEPAPPDIVSRNGAVVARAFSPARYRTRLEQAYATVAASAPARVGHHAEGRVLDFFLDPSRFYLLRT